MKESNNVKTEKQSVEEPSYIGHRKRLKDRFNAVGLKGFHDVEKLEFLLCFAIPRKDTKPIARDLLKRFGSIQRVFEASADQLEQVKGVTPNTSILIRLFYEMLTEYLKTDFDLKNYNSVNELGAMLVDYFKGSRNEKLAVVCLDSSCKILSVEDVGEGDITGVMLNFRRIVEITLKYPKTAAIVLAHNHPNGLALPSREDVDSTINAIRTLGCMDINLVDHFIIIEDDFVSMAQSPRFKNIFK